jgi:hypothetical protein
VIWTLQDAGASGSAGDVSPCGCPWAGSGGDWLVPGYASSSCSSRCVASSCARRTIVALSLLQSMRGSPLTPLLQNRACEFPRTRLLGY